MPRRAPAAPIDRPTSRRVLDGALMARAFAPPLLELTNVRKDFVLDAGLIGRLTGRRRVLRALDDVSLVVRRGEVLGLVGESGSGKSTLAEVAVRLLTVDAGAVAYRGEPVTYASGRALRPFRRGVQMVFQDTGSSLNPRKTVGRTLDEALALRGVARGERLARVERLLGLVGLGSFVRARYPHQLSGGQRQRVAIARALAMEPELLVADEPVASLDVSLQAQIVNLLLRLRHELGLTLLFISHDLALVSHISTRVAVMYAGRIVEEGPADRVLRQPAHPYTQALLAAIPKGLRGRAARRDPTGEPAPATLDPSAPVAGCRFAPRCPVALPLCATKPARMRRLATEHVAECHRHDAPPAALDATLTQAAE
jgi:oligopeptide/dipeptide ABC transporter ATP-binding protein